MAPNCTSLILCVCQLGLLSFIVAILFLLARMDLGRLFAGLEVGSEDVKRRTAELVRLLHVRCPEGLGKVLLKPSELNPPPPNSQ